MCVEPLSPGLSFFCPKNLNGANGAKNGPRRLRFDAVFVTERRHEHVSLTPVPVGAPD